MTLQLLAETLAQAQENLTSMSPACVAGVEKCMQETLSALTHEGLDNVDASHLAACTAEIGRLRALAEHASALYLGWLQVVSSAACGYTPAGPAQLQLYAQIVTEG